jgi:hypothetical protein
MPNVTVIWASHFPPLKQADLARTLRLLDSGRLTDAARELKVPLILSGHIHHSREKKIDHALHVCVSGTATSLEPIGANSLHLMECELEEGVLCGWEKIDYVWDENERWWLIKPGKRVSPS